MIFFKEQQRFNQWWIWGLLGMTNLIILLNFGHAYYEQLLLGNPWGDKPMPGTGLILSSLFAFTVLIVVNALIFGTSLETKIDKNHIQYRFFPYVRRWKKVDRTDLKEAYVRKYSPISEFGGWGYRALLRDSNKALNIKGNMGLQLVFKNGKRLLLGTQKPDQLKEVMKKFMNIANPADHG